MFATAHVYFGVVFSGLANFLSPCLLPLVPAYLAYMCATFMRCQGGDSTERSIAWRTTFLASVAFALGFTLVFAIRGSQASWLGQTIALYSSQVSMIAGIVIMLFGLYFLGCFPRPWASPSSNICATSLGALLIGLAFGLSWTPCVGPVLAAVLSIASQQPFQRLGTMLLVTYGLGLTMPFIVMGALIALVGSVMNVPRDHFSVPIRLAGAFLIFCGLLVATRSLAETGDWLLDSFPGLGRLDDLFTSASLRTEILNAAGRP